MGMRDLPGGLADVTGPARSPREDATAVAGLPPHEHAKGLRIVLAGVLLYVALHMGFRLLASSTLGEDDTLDQLLAQELRFGYDPRQPPLYDWVLYAVQQVTGPHLVSFLTIKYAALTATAVFLYLAASRVLADRLWAVLTVESLALIYQISWRYHEGFTHEVLAMTAVAATLWAFLRLHDRGSRGDHVLFGLIAGLGLLTEPNYAVYQLCLWGAVALDPAIRHRVLRPALAISALLAAAIAAPFALWVVHDPAHWRAILQPSANGHARDVLIGLKDAVRGPFMYLSPLVVILPLAFPGFLRTAAADLRALWHDPATHAGRLDLLVARATLLGLVLSVLGAVTLGIGGYAMHVLMPLYVASVIWLFAIAQRSRASSRRLKIFAVIALLIAVAAFNARMANMFILDPVCNKCRWGIPYAELAREMRKAGVGDRATIVTTGHELGGNLRQHFPKARIVLGDDALRQPPGPGALGDVVVVVADAAPTDRRGEALAAALTARGLHADPARVVDVPWHHLWRPKGYRTSPWRIQVLRRP